MILQLGWCAQGLGSFLPHLCACCILGSVSLHSHCPATVQMEASVLLSCAAILVPIFRLGGAFC